MEPFDNYGMPHERPAEESQMSGQTSLPFHAPLPDATVPAARRGFARFGRPRRTVIAGVTVAALAATGGVALAAANSNPTPGGPGAAAMMHGRGGPVHGTFTISDGKGGYQTELMQRGTVQSFSGGTLTVRSADGYTHSYSTDSTTVFGRGGRGGHGMRGGNWGPMHGRFGNLPNGTAVPNGTAPSATVPQAGTAVPNNATPSNTTAATPTLTVGENVMVIAISANGTDHAQRVMPIRTPNQNGQNGTGGFFGRHRGFGGMNGQMPGVPQQNGQGTAAPATGQPGGQMGNGPMTGGPMGNGQTAPGQMNNGPQNMGNGPVNLPNNAPATAGSPASTPQSGASPDAAPTDTTNG